MRAKAVSCIAISVLFSTLVFPICALADDEVRLGIAGFSVGDIRGVGSQINADTMFIKSLRDIEGVMVLERRELVDKIGSEVKFQQAGLVDDSTAVQLGKIAGVNYMLLGVVSPTDKMEAKRHESVNTYKDKKGNVQRTVTLKVEETHEVSVTITARIVDVETSRVIWSGSETSEDKERKTYDAANYHNGISNALVAAMAERLAQESAYFLAYKIRREFANEYIYVTDRSGNDFIIDAGTSHGIENGMVFLVYAEGNEIKGRDGKILGVEPIIIAALKVKNVQGAYSVCSVAKPSVGEAIRVGDRAEPIRFKRSSKLAYPKKRPENLASKKPSKSDALIAELMGESKEPPKK